MAKQYDPGEAGGGVEKRLAVIGGGAMAGAILSGAARVGAVRTAEVVVAEPDAGRREAMRALGVAVVERAAEAVGALGRGGRVLLAVKPQSLEAVSRDLGGGAFDGEVISILAGAGSERVREAMGGTCRVVRVMPNLPAQVGKGVAAIALGAGARPGDDAFAIRLFEAVGAVVRIEERLMDAFTALAGSGPAYVYYLAEAMTRAAKEMGFDEATADHVVRGVIAGSGELLACSTAGSAAQLRAGVTSKGGTTEAAIRVMEEAGVMGAVVRAIVAARDRGAELGKA